MAAPLSPELRDLLALHLVPGLGPRLTAALLEHFGSAAAVLQARREQLCEVPHIGDLLAARICRALRDRDVDAEVERLAQHDTRLLALGTAEYPAPLANIPDPPHLLYVRGAWQAQDANAVALVGSRHCTAYGRRVAERLAAGLAQKGYSVISGLPQGTSLMTTRSGRRWIRPRARSLRVRPLRP
jgi:DNA processing protein